MQVGTDQVGTAQVGIAQVGIAQVGAVQVGTAQVGTDQVGTDQVGTVQVGAVQVGIAQVGAVQVGAVQVGIAQVGALRYRLHKRMPCAQSAGDALWYIALEQHRVRPAVEDRVPSSCGAHCPLPVALAIAARTACPLSLSWPCAASVLRAECACHGPGVGSTSILLTPC